MNDKKIIEVRALNETFYELFGSLHENAAHLTAKQVEFMGAKLHELYKGEYAKIVHELELENAREAFTHRARCVQLVPRVRRFLFSRRPDLGKLKLSHENRAASAILDAIEAETDAFFERCAKALEPEKRDDAPPDAARSQEEKQEKIPQKRERRSKTSANPAPETGKGDKAGNGN